MEDFDDFDDLYGDVEVVASSVVNTVHGLSQLPSKNDYIHDNATENCEDDEPRNGDDVNVDNATTEVAAAEAAEEEEEEEEEEGSSESEDDLNIVLNDDDDDDDDLEINTKINNVNVNKLNNGLGSDIDGNQEGNERYDNGIEQALGGGAGGGRGRGVVGGYNSQYKSVRFHTPAFPSNLKGSGSAGVAYSSMTVKGVQEDSGYIHHRGSNSLASQNGHIFYLPRSRTILDVNIDTFQQIPWRHPGADITDFFNYGFNENSWKNYCTNLVKYRKQRVKASRTSTSKSSRYNTACEVGYANQEFTHEVAAEKVAYSMQQHAELIGGRPIQVENCSFERQPSTDLWRPLDRDSDVIIQIALQDLDEDCLTSTKEGVDQINTLVHEVSEIENDSMDEARDIPCSSSAIEDEQPSLEGHGDGSGNSLPESSSRRRPASGPISMYSNNNGGVRISESDEHHKQQWSDMNGTAEAMEAFDDTGESVERQISSAAPSVVEPESINGGQSPHSLTSPSSHSPFEQPRSSACVDLREPRRQSKVASPRSMSEVRESVTCEYLLSKDSKSYGDKPKRQDPKFHARVRSSRYRSPMWDDLKYDRRGHTSDLNSSMDDEDICYLSDSAKFYYTRHSTIIHKKQKNDQRGFDSYGKQYNSYHEASEPFYDHGDQKLSNDDCSKSQSWKKYARFGYKLDERYRRDINENQSHFERRVARVHHKEVRQDFYDHERRHAVPDMEFLTREESRQWTPKYNLHLENEEGKNWKTTTEDWHLRKSVKNDNFLLESHYQSDLMREKYRDPMLYVENDREFQQHKYDKHLSYNRREIGSPGRNRISYGSPFNDVHNTWGADYEYQKGRCTRAHPQSFSSCKRPCSPSRPRRRGAVSPKRGIYRSRGRNWRRIWGERSNNSDELCNLDDVFDTNENRSTLGDQDHFVRSGLHWQSEISHWNVEQDHSLNPEANVYAERASYLSEWISGPRMFDIYHGSGSDHVRKVKDCKQVTHGGFKLTREIHKGSQRQNSNFTYRDNHGERLRRCRGSVDSHLVGADKESIRRSFEARNIHCGSYEYMDCDTGLKQKIFGYSNRSYTENATQAENSKVDTKKKGKHWHDKFSDVQHNDSQEIEEGQIITEEVNGKALEKRSSSEDTGQIGDKRNLHNESTINGNVAFEGLGNPRILEIIAKMEKRRERFKQPITLTKDAEKTSSQTPVYTVVEISDSKPQRPARKRKW